jgi:hypothetical protein
MRRIKQDESRNLFLAEIRLDAVQTRLMWNRLFTRPESYRPRPAGITYRPANQKLFYMRRMETG